MKKKIKKKRLRSARSGQSAKVVFAGARSCTRQTCLPVTGTPSLKSANHKALHSTAHIANHRTDGRTRTARAAASTCAAWPRPRRRIRPHCLAAPASPGRASSPPHSTARRRSGRSWRPSTTCSVPDLPWRRPPRVLRQWRPPRPSPVPAPPTLLRGRRQVLISYYSRNHEKSSAASQSNGIAQD